MYIPNTTAAERVTIRNVVDDVILEVERAQSLLGDILEDYFWQAEKKALDKYDTDHVGEMLQVIDNIMFDAVLTYCLTVGRTDFRGIGPHLEGMKRVQSVLECEELANKLAAKGGADTRNARAAIEELPDAEAIPALRAILNEK